MNATEAKKFGSSEALKAVSIGILIAQLIMTQLSSGQGFVKAFFWFETVNYKLNIVVGVMIMFICGHLYGQAAGKAIIIKKRNATITGIVCGILVLLSTGLLSGITGFLQEGIGNLGTEDNPFIDYIMKPFFWISIFGFVPAIVVGIWFGRQVKKKA